MLILLWRSRMPPRRPILRLLPRCQQRVGKVSSARDGRHCRQPCHLQPVPRFRSLSTNARGACGFGVDEEKRKGTGSLALHGCERFLAIRCRRGEAKKCMSFARSSRMREVLADLVLTRKSKSLMCGRRRTAPPRQYVDYQRWSHHDGEQTTDCLLLRSFKQAMATPVLASGCWCGARAPEAVSPMNSSCSSNGHGEQKMVNSVM